MTAFSGLAAGLCIGSAAGLWMARDLTVSTRRMLAGRAGGRVAFGLFRRMAVMVLGLASGLSLGHHALAGSAMGIIVGFFAYIAARVRA